MDWFLEKTNCTIHKEFYEHRSPIHKESYERYELHWLQIVRRDRLNISIFVLLILSEIAIMEIA